MRRILLATIKLYQATLSPDHGPRRRLYPAGYCRYFPTCSAYAYEAIDKHGTMYGAWLTMKRLVRCHPWTVGGFDPIPHQHP